MDLDLNLLRVFDALNELRSVTRAAARLGLTQSAISHALGRLRTVLGDPLFHRAPGGLQPTARAMEIAPGIREGLAQLRSALNPSLFDPARAERHFTINTGSYFCTMLIPDLVAKMRIQAPSVSLTIVNRSADLLPMLDDGSVDLALGAFGKVPPRLLCEPLFSDQLVWIVARDNPLLDAPDCAERIVHAPRLDIMAGRPSPGLGSFSTAGGLEWRVASHIGPANERRVAVYDAVSAARLVSKTDLVARIPRQLALRAAAPGLLAIVESGRDAEGMEMSMVSHRRMSGDAALIWLRALVVDVLPDLLGKGAHMPADAPA